MRKLIKRKPFNSKYWETDTKYSEIPQQFWTFEGFPRISKKNGNASKIIFDPFPCWIVAVLRRFHVTSQTYFLKYIFPIWWCKPVNLCTYHHFAFSCREKWFRKLEFEASVWFLSQTLQLFQMKFSKLLKSTKKYDSVNLIFIENFKWIIHITRMNTEKWWRPYFNGNF